jgi:hypothetical protein
MGREKGHNAREHTSTHGSWADTLKTMTSFNIRPTYGNSNNTQAPHHHIHTSSSTGPHSNEQNAQSKTTLSNHITRCHHSTTQATTPQRIRIHTPNLGYSSTSQNSRLHLTAENSINSTHQRPKKRQVTTTHTQEYIPQHY